MILEDYLKKEDEQKIYADKPKNGDDLKHEDNINTSLAAPGALALNFLLISFLIRSFLL